MLTLRQKQIDAIAEDRLRRFEDRAIGYIRSQFPETAVSGDDAELRKRVRTAVVKANSYGLTGERDILRYLHVMYAAGFDFDTRCSWAEMILRDPELEPQSKTEELLLRAAR